MDNQIGTVGDKLVFYNFTEEVFNGRHGGVNYTIQPKEKVTYDQDKHYMLVHLSKQLADHELLKKIKGVGRNPNNNETWAKSLDVNGKPFNITPGLRKELMKQAVGDLVDKPVPIPEGIKDVEAGSTQETNKKIEALQDEIRELKNLVTKAVDKGILSDPPKVDAPAQEKETVANSMYRQTLVEMAREEGIEVTPQMTKQDIINALAQKVA